MFDLVLDSTSDLFVRELVLLTKFLHVHLKHRLSPTQTQRFSRGELRGQTTALVNKTNKLGVEPKQILHHFAIYYAYIAAMLRRATTLNGTLLPIDAIKFDFEDFVEEHGIPELLDPMPYRVPTSIFQGDSTSKPKSLVTSAKNDPRLRTIVCRHWLRGLCMKGNSCEFLHKFDLERMPYCHYQTIKKCKTPGCYFRHVNPADEEESSSNVARSRECSFYRQGFCKHGSRCRYEHHARKLHALPIVGNFTLGPRPIHHTSHHAGKRDATSTLSSTGISSNPSLASNIKAKRPRRC